MPDLYVILLGHGTSVPQIDGAIRPQVIKAFNAAIDNYESVDLTQLRYKVRRLIQNDEYIVTLDGGVIFSQYDFSIEITRACTKIDDANVGPYIRMPRPLSAQLSQQFINVKANFQNAQKKRVVLCDDGIGTGGTIRRILNGLKDVGINVSNIVTVTNPTNILALEGVPIKTLYQSNVEYNWLNERDLYWGLPRSGLSTSVDRSFVGLGGIPYTVNKKMVVSRIGIDPAKAEQFRQACITANITFWKLLEKFHGRKLEIRDCSRLGFFSKIYGNNGEVLKILNDCRQRDILKGTVLDHE